MNELEIGRIAAAANQLRPDWPVASVATLLNKPTIINRPRRDVAVALAWIASDSDTRTPGRILEAGPWWQAAATDAPKERSAYDPNEICNICSYKEHVCRQTWPDDHDFESVTAARRRRGGLPNAPSTEGHMPEGMRQQLAEQFAANKAKQVPPASPSAATKDDAQ